MTPPPAPMVALPLPPTPMVAPPMDREPMWTTAEGERKILCVSDVYARYDPDGGGVSSKQTKLETWRRGIKKGRFWWDVFDV